MTNMRTTDCEVLVCGTINWDTLIFVETLPAPGEEVEVRRTMSVPGGKGANTAVSAARLLGRRRVALIATLGKDAIAEKQLRALNRQGVITDAVLSLKKGLVSGRASVIIDGEGQDMILTHMASNSLMSPQLLKENQVVLELIRKPKIVLIADPPLKASVWIAKQAKKWGASLILAPALLTRLGLMPLKNYLLLGDYIIVNEQESATLLGSRYNGGIDASLTISRLLGGSTVIVTLGNEGCAISSKGQKAVVPAVDLSSFGLEVVNTAGAGDTFVGSFCAFKARGLDDITSVHRANVAAALKATKSEIRSSPGLGEIERFVKKAKLDAVPQEIRFA